jgi:hypothetical protein
MIGKVSDLLFNADIHHEYSIVSLVVVLNTCDTLNPSDCLPEELVTSAA